MVFDLNSGYVPVQRIRDFIAAQLNITDGYFAPNHPELVCFTRMWNTSDRPWQTLNGTGEAKNQEWMEFDIADKMLCLLGLQGHWREELEDIYLAVDLSGVSRSRMMPKGVKRCEANGCANTFVDLHRGHPRHYCSKTCRMTQRGRRRKGRRSLDSKRYDTCPHGHDRSPENAAWGKGVKGKLVLRCRVCIKEKQRAYRARLKVAA